jgi:prepilin-type N-terminal cleavage/methylation domain-containing protein
VSRIERRSRRGDGGFSGFTLVELLVVITIIGILIALLLPAVQAAREAARKMQCTNNIKQVTLGLLGHEEHYKFFPSGGWSWEWSGDPDRGTGRDQPGNWIYAILPYIEQQALHDLGMDGDRKNVTQAQLDGSVARAQQVLTVFNCPTRRQAILYPFWPGWTGVVPCYQSDGGYIPYNGGKIYLAGRSDYGANAGDQTDCWGGGCPADMNQANTWDTNHGWPNIENRSSPGAGAGPATGICYFRSQVTMADIADGASNTYCVGEKYLNPDFYYNGEDHGDNEFLFCGYDNESHRLTYCDETQLDPASSGYAINLFYAPKQDTPGEENWLRFGSAHATGFNASFCDGAVQFINYSIDVVIHHRLGNRKDGLPIDASKLKF